MNSLIFWMSLGVLVYVYFGYMAICMVLGVIFKKQRKQEDILPSVSLIIPAFNEACVMRQKIENSLGLDYPKEKLEIVVASESQDQTNSIVAEYASQGVILCAYEQRQGKSRMIYLTIPKTRGEIIVFSDANAIFKPDALRKLVRNFSDDRIGAALGKLVISNPKKSAASTGESVYKKYEGILRRYNSYLRSVLGADGSIFGIRRELYFPIDPDHGDDFELTVRILLKGYGVVFEPEAVSYEQASDTLASEVKRKIRIVSWFFKSAFILLKEMFWPLQIFLIWQVISHKILRWLSPYFLLGVFFSNLFLCNTHPGYRIFFYAQSTFYLMAACGWFYLDKRKKQLPLLLKLPTYFLMFNYAFFLGTLRGIFLKQKPVWEKVR
ncbi:MAG: glycosyltransferase family 2 protein [Candidatus Omnitrophota bacterium]